MAIATQVETFRAEFPVTEQWSYLNHAAIGPYPTRTVEALKAFADLFADTPSFLRSERDDLTQETAMLIGELAGAAPEMVAFVPSLADGMNVFANGIDWRDGDNVLIPVDEFPSVVYPFLNLSYKGVSVRFVEKDAEGRTDPARIEAAIDGRTRAVALSHVEFMDGYRNDLGLLAGICRERGVELFVDATQSLGAQPVEVAKTGVSGIAAHGYKWLMSSFGIGVAVFSEDAIERIRPTYAGRLSVDVGYEDLSYRMQWKPGAARYQTGGLNVLGLTAMHASLSLVTQAGPDWTATHTTMLNDRLIEGLTDMGYSVASSTDPAHRSQIVAFSAGSREQDAQIVVDLERANVSVTLRGKGVRVSPYFYNTLDDIEKLLEALPPR
jgi:cysteine desulfurase/selenocysteine lyase